jgi:protocatechuate 3,4-dioxygenase beta subunit
MYFPDDPLIEIDPIANAVPLPYRQRLVSRFDIETTQPNWALGYLFDVVLRGRDATPRSSRTIIMTEQVNPAPRLDNQDPGLFGQTPSQTVGPFFHYGLPWKGGADLVGQSDMGARPELFPEEHYVLNLAPPKGAVSGEVITLEGVVYDAEGKPVPDAMIEIWQANAAGRYASPDDDRTEIPLDEGFIGFGRASTSDEGLYRFKTVLPGPCRVPATACRRRTSP